MTLFVVSVSVVLLVSAVGEEIVDEADAAADMQEVARRRRREHFE